MLTEIRDRSSGWFAYVIASLIIIPMAFWGVQEYANTQANPSLVEVGDQKISQAQFRQQLSSEQQRMREAMGDRVNNDLLSSEGFKQNVLQQMINRALLEQIAVDQNYRIGDKQLAAAIRDSELFQADGKFDEVAYEQYVLSSQYSKTRYETALRGDKRLAQVTTGYAESALVLPDEVRALLEIQAEQRSFDLITIRQQDFLDSASVADADITEYYEANQADFLEPEKITLSYLELNVDQITPTIEVDEEELRAIYQQNLESYISAEKRETRHILLSTTGGEDDGEQRAKAEQLVSELKAGKDFASLAKEHSKDTGSASRGGSLGLVELGQMVPEFEQATFSLAEGEISAPIKTQFGYHIIQVQSIQRPEQQAFEEVKFDLQREERDRLAEETLLEQVDQLRDLAFEQPDNLDAAAEQLGLKILTTAAFDRDSGEGIASSALVRDAAFSEQLLVDENNSEPIEVAEGQYVVIRKAVYQPAEPKALAAVKDQITDLLRTQGAVEAAQQAGNALLDKARANWQSIIDDGQQVNSHTIALIDNNREVSPEVQQTVVSMRLDNDLPSVSSVADRNGDFHVLRLTKITAGNIDGVSEQIKDSTRRILAQRNGESLMMSYLDSLGESLDKVINSDLL